MYRSLYPADLVGSLRSALLARHWPTDSELRFGWERFPLYTSGASKTRHVLESLEERLTTNEEPVNLRYSKITIEHIMPQSLSEVWQDELGPDYATIHTTYLHTIGNLTLTGKNEPMGNAPLSEKKKVLGVSNFALNKGLAALSSWGPVEIRTRSAQLFEVASVIWARPAEDTTENRSENPAGHKPKSFRLFGVEYPAKSWRSVLLGVCVILEERHGSDFANMVAQVRGTKRQYVGTNPEMMLRPQQIPGTDLWVEMNFSADRVLWVVGELLRACGEDEKALSVIW